jgi:hypothetical protein
MNDDDVTAESTAPLSVAWALLVDARSWPTWTPTDALEAQSRVSSNGESSR